MAIRQVARALRPIIFRAFYRTRERAASSRNHGLNHARRRTKCRRNFRGIERCKASTGSRTDIEKPSAALKRP